MFRQLLVGMVTLLALGVSVPVLWAQAAAEYSMTAGSAAASAANAGAALGQATQQAAGRAAQSLGGALGRTGRVPRRGMVRRNSTSPVATRGAAASCTPPDLESLGSGSAIADSRVITLGSTPASSGSAPTAAGGKAANPESKTNALESKPKSQTSLPPCPPQTATQTQYKSVINLSFSK